MLKVYDAGLFTIGLEKQPKVVGLPLFFKGGYPTTDAFLTPFSFDS
jgi:hypothetical protein